jgi:hypothetical protein
MTVQVDDTKLINLRTRGTQSSVGRISACLGRICKKDTGKSGRSDDRQSDMSDEIAAGKLNHATGFLTKATTLQAGAPVSSYRPTMGQNPSIPARMTNDVRATRT